MDNVNLVEKSQLVQMKDDIISEVRKDIELALAKFKVLILATMLSNIVILGVPATYTFFSVSGTASKALELAKDNADMLKKRNTFIASTTRRLESIEDHLVRSDKYVKPAIDPALVP